MKMEKKKKSLKNIDYPSEKVIMKLINSSVREDRILGAEFVIQKYGMITNRAKEMADDFFKGKTVVLRDTAKGTEVVIGNYGALERKITEIKALGVEIYWI